MAPSSTSTHLLLSGHHRIRPTHPPTYFALPPSLPEQVYEYRTIIFQFSHTAPLPQLLQPVVQVG